jgi:hypothetical protein
MWGADGGDPGVAGPNQVQVAVWRDRRLLSAEKDIDVKGKFVMDRLDQSVVEIDPANTDSNFWDEVRRGDYVRHARWGVWYEIADLDKDNDKVTLTGTFHHPLLRKDESISGDLEVASQNNLISTHTFIVRP